MDALSLCKQCAKEVCTSTAEVIAMHKLLKDLDEKIKNTRTLSVRRKYYEESR